MPRAPRGHVFVVHGDITTMNVDAWILPTDRFAHIRSRHWKVEGSEQGERRQEFSQAFQDGNVWAEALPWPHTSPGVPICTAVPDHAVRTPDDLRARLRYGLKVAAEQATLAERRTRKARAKGGRKRVPRVAMPTFGTDGGGGGAVVGSFLRFYLDIATECAKRHGVDVIIGCLNSASYHGLQILRCTDSGEAPARWPELTAEQRERATALGQLARSGQLVPFMGSGVSKTSGLPDWKGLLEALRGEADLHEITADAFGSLPTLDQAELLASVLGSELRKKIVAVTTAKSVGLPPLLLASLPGREAVTLNYDTLFEDARQQQDRPVTVLPGGTVTSDVSWLLKLHGSIDREQDIVLTRHDYLAYASTRSALSSLAVALLLTRHLFFVGFGFGDDHFHRLIHEVRSFRGPESAEGAPGSNRLGTALMLGRNPIRERLWRNHVDIIEFDGSYESAGRIAEIFLDRMVACAVETPTYFLRSEYGELLTTSERELAQCFEHLMNKIDQEQVRPSVRNAFYQLHHKLGGADNAV